MILSRLAFTRQDMLRLKMTDAYSLHRVVYSCFPLEGTNAPRGENAAFLYADLGMRGDMREVLTLSNVAPNRPHWGEQVQSKPVPPTLLEHNAYAFCLTINPVRRDNASRKIVPLRGSEAITRWFCEKAPSWGFGVDERELTIEENGVWEFVKKEQPVTLAYAKLRGTLRVIDREAFVVSFRRGIGRAKAFGCGMLQIVPVRYEENL